MRQMMQAFLLFFLLLALAACSSVPQVFWDTDEGRDVPDYARGASNRSNANARPMLEVPPELRSELDLPGAKEAGTNGAAGSIPQQYREAVAGKAVALHARLYHVPPEQLFSAAVDAMTSLNLPVDSVDSPSGIITTEWVREGSKGSEALLGLDILGDLLGGGSSKAQRYRFVVRIFKVRENAQFKSRLEVRLLGQMLKNRHWVNRPVSNKPSLKLFSAVEKQLGRIQPQQPAVVETGAE